MLEHMRILTAILKSSVFFMQEREIQIVSIKKGNCDEIKIDKVGSQCAFVLWDSCYRILGAGSEVLVFTFYLPVSEPWC